MFVQAGVNILAFNLIIIREKFSQKQLLGKSFQLPKAAKGRAKKNSQTKKSGEEFPQLKAVPNTSGIPIQTMWKRLSIFLPQQHRFFPKSNKNGKYHMIVFKERVKVFPMPAYQKQYRRNQPYLFPTHSQVTPILPQTNENLRIKLDGKVKSVRLTM